MHISESRRWAAGLFAGALSLAVMHAAHAGSPAIEAADGKAASAEPGEPPTAPYAAAFALRVPAAATAMRVETARRRLDRPPRSTRGTARSDVLVDPSGLVERAMTLFMRSSSLKTLSS